MPTRSVHVSHKASADDWLGKVFPDLIGPQLELLEDDLADRFYVIAQGEVTIGRRGPEGDEMKLAVGDVDLLGLSWERFQESLERSDRADCDFSQIAKERIAFAP